MSSPIAKTNKTKVDQTLISVHRRLSHGHRVDTLASEFATRIRALPAPGETAALRVLDIGCGDMTLTDALVRQVPECQVQCVDVHPCPPELAARDSRWSRYRQFDGVNLPFEDGSFDVALFSDVLHHVPEDSRRELLANAARVSRWVLVKDHFEYGMWSRQCLRLMDFVGNFGYGVSVPQRYFDRARFDSLCDEAGLVCERLDVGVQLYAHLPVLRTLLSSRWQFISHCRRAAS